MFKSNFLVAFVVLFVLWALDLFVRPHPRAA